MILLREFALLRNAVLVFLATLVVSLAAVSVTLWQLRMARIAEAAQLLERDAARARLAHAEAEKEEIRLYQPQFMELRRRGLVGPERRLDWVEAIRQIQEQRRLLPLSYEIEVQQPYRLETALPTGDYALLGSRMVLHMDLLHELDLLNFLADLRVAGMFAVQDCSIRRTAKAPGLSADCTLNWLTLTPTAAAAGRGAAP
ncbi:hypothetical protein GTP41_17220 [Pseudoduganella sp. DS3]|uniref:Uncharacterized protein n=1 Tax=Pseudoduganella guangdongensis TaxID=2692179 RepID=A0A6N9HKS0_9BURK|nr:hypothetical protein [Pseudoduganella guangdongensis]MYN03837.1 hypothetical protein [Pseudoduganella guangdongensis]